MNLYARIIGLPEVWYEFDLRNSTILVHQITNRTGISWERYWELSSRTQNSKKLQQINVIGPYYNKADYFDSMVLLPYAIDQTTVRQTEKGDYFIIFVLV